MFKIMRNSDCEVNCLLSDGCLLSMCKSSFNCCFRSVAALSYVGMASLRRQCVIKHIKVSNDTVKTYGKIKTLD